MLIALLLALLLCCLSGVWLWLSWRSQAAELPEIRVAFHAVSAAAVLIALVLGLDNHSAGDGLRLLAVFLGISTGMLLFLKRQRKRLHPQALLAAHIVFGLAAVAIVAWNVL